MEEMTKLWRIMRKKAGAMLLGGFFVAALSFAFLVVSQANFQANTQYLIVQDQKNGPQDFFSLSKSVEYTGKVMSEAIYSQLFVDEVVKTGKVDEEFLPFNQKDRLEAWAKMVRVQRDPQLGIISVTVYHDEQNQALRISEAVAQVFNEKNYLFRGSGQDIDIRVISGPILEQNPTLEAIAVAVAGGLLLGMLLVLVRNFYREERYESEFLVLGREARKQDARSIPLSPQEYEESLRYLDK